MTYMTRKLPNKRRHAPADWRTRDNRQGKRLGIRLQPRKTTMTLTALAINCTLKTKRAEDPSSTDRMLKLLAVAMEPLDVTPEFLQLADYGISPGLPRTRATATLGPTSIAGF